jgi:transcriptional antiterminator RfaH
MKQWYTLHTKPSAEYQVATAMQRRGVQTYLPELESPHSRQERKTKPFFPCYLFARIDFEVTGLSQLQWTPGLRRIVAFGGRPVPLSDEVIDLVRHRLDGVGATGGRPVGHDFHQGDEVRITDGPLQGMLAIFEGPSTPSERVHVLLTFLGHLNRVHVSAADLQKVSTAAQSPVLKRPRRTRGRGRHIKYR